MPVVIGELLPHRNVVLGKDDDVLLQLASDRVAGGLVAGVAVGSTGVVQQVGHVACTASTSL